jgi:hypothetical protein
VTTRRFEGSIEVETERRWARVVLAAQDPDAVGDRDAQVHEAVAVGLRPGAGTVNRS